MPITPLMAKLTILAQEESQLETPISSKTPGCTSKGHKGLSITPICETKKSTEENLNGEQSNNIQSCENIDNGVNIKSVQDLTPLGLYVFGENSTSVLLLIELTTATNPESIHSLVSVKFLILTSSFLNLFIYLFKQV